MPAHLLVTQLRFARGEFVRAFEGVSPEDARRRIMPMNSLGWIVGHLANQEHRYWVMFAQQKNLAPELYDLVGYGKPASTPALDEMWQVWRTVTAAADAYLETLTPRPCKAPCCEMGSRWMKISAPCSCATSTTIGITPVKPLPSVRCWDTRPCPSLLEIWGRWPTTPRPERHPPGSKRLLRVCC